MKTYNKIYMLLSMCVSVGGTQYADSSLTMAESVAVGGVVGAAEVAFPGQLFSYAMNKAINKQPFVMKDSYNGFGVNALSQMPITAMQMATQTMGKQFVEQWQEAPLSGMQSAVVSYGAGVAGALIDTPSNAIQLYLQEAANSGKSSWQAVKALRLNAFRGFVANAFLKEGLFAVGYQVLAPKGREVVANYVGDNVVAAALGGAGAGVLTAVVTHPGAVLRNTIQAAVMQQRYLTVWKAVQQVCATQGCKGLFRGLKERGTRVMIAVPLYAAYTTALQRMLAKPAKEPSYFEQMQQYCGPYAKVTGLVAAAALVGYVAYQKKAEIGEYMQKMKKVFSKMKQGDVASTN